MVEYAKFDESIPEEVYKAKETEYKTQMFEINAQIRQHKDN